jgi:hypothetical protein
MTLIRMTHSRITINRMPFIKMPNYNHAIIYRMSLPKLHQGKYGPKVSQRRKQNSKFVK